MTKIHTSQNKILDLLQQDDLVAAPLAGITSPPFRLVMRKFFKGIIYTEMVSVEGIKRKTDRTLAYLNIREVDRPVGLQLFGSKPESFVEAIQVMEEYTNPDIIDINMGCPVKKVLKSGSGSALLKNTPLIAEIVRAARKTTSKPLTIKIRPGWDSNSLVYKEVLNIAENEGVDALTVHGRVKTDMFGGTVRYDIIEEMAGLAKIPIIGNGDVKDRASYEKMKATGVDGVMIGRGLMKQPWIFEAIRKDVDPAKYLSPPQLAQLLREIAKAEREYRGTMNYQEIIKKFAVWFAKGLKGATEFRGTIYKTATEEELFDLIDSYFVETNLNIQ